MAKKSETKEVTSAEMSVKELEVRLAEVRENHFRLQFRHASNPLKNPMQIREARREVARIKTILHQKKQGTS
jgi:large subunit ribosomal protein L29